VAGVQKRLHSEELHNVCASLNTVRMMRWTLHLTRMKEMRNAYKILIGKPQEKRPLGRSRRKWVL
jgi:hypothetical protein